MAHSGPSPLEHFHDAFRYDDPEFAERYDDVTQDLLLRCPVVESPAGYFLVTRYADVRECAVNPEFRVGEGVLKPRPAGLPLQFPQEADPPLHGQLRKAISPYFARTAVAKYRPQAREIADDLIDGFAERGGCDAVTDYARPLPGRVFFTCLLGLPAEQAAQLGKAVYQMFSGHPDGVANFDRGVDAVLSYHEDEAPDNELMRAINALEVDGVPAPRSTKKSLLGALVVGGLETTSSVLAQAIYHLGTHPGDRDGLASAPSRDAAAVEEFLRLFAPAWALGRVVASDVAAAGAQFHEGDFVYLGWGPASRDPRAFPAPLEFELDRREQAHLAFGIGRHYCLGAHLARLELEVALRALLDRIPDFVVQPGTTPRFSNALNRTIAHVPIRFG